MMMIAPQGLIGPMTRLALIPLVLTLALLVSGCTGLAARDPIDEVKVQVEVPSDPEPLLGVETKPPQPAETSPLPLSALPHPEPRPAEDFSKVPDAVPSPYGADPFEDPYASEAKSEPEPLAELPVDPRLLTITPEAPLVPKLPVAPVIHRGFTLEAPPAVAGLEKEIDTQMAAQHYAEAATILERAIRIQPKNPELWHVLALARLRQNQAGQAEDLAKKSNLLAKSHAALTKLNWQVIAEARRLQGNYRGSMDAAQRGW